MSDTPPVGRNIAVGVKVTNAEGQVIRMEVFEVGLYFEAEVPESDLTAAEQTAQEYAQATLMPEIAAALAGTSELGTPATTPSRVLFEEGPAAPPRTLDYTPPVEEPGADVTEPVGDRDVVTSIARPDVSEFFWEEEG